MSMNIKNADVERLTRELADLTGETLTTAVSTAVRERLERLRGSGADGRTTQRAEQILALGRSIAPSLTEPWRSRDHGELLYDERGLPA
jgi:antitoxin VapB